MCDYLDFSNKVVLVTGSTRNIGRSIAEMFASHGASVIINSRHPEDVERTANEFTSHGFKAIGVSADVGDPDGVGLMFDEIRKNLGRLDVLVNNAAIRPFENPGQPVDRDSFEDVMRTNVMGAFNVTRSAIALMLERNGGSVVNILSTSAVHGSSIAGLDYAVSKGALYSLTRALAFQLREEAAKGRPVRVNGVMLPPIRTEGSAKSESDFEAAAKISFLRRSGLPEEVASVCLFLASDLASYVTGEVIALGGVLKPTVDI